ncbi:OmpH family outer membrane protein [Roseibacillus ishigakijimensis]|uniref:OmpH family outer membrane protein n=1 Tax=Roseibacillus ishigakijimensis TaxID=454146 RepID=A0A934RK04_9BACT|nr:OmpH family outer membrane protein [Roseibacillus ishigakijimensis]MBK1833107.1 OmpH family outer membrane protein [Roseibacillus ishigakijimensis]
MKTGFFFAALFALLSFAQLGAQDLKVATVDMKRLLKDYYRTEEAQQELNEKQALLTKANNEKQQEIQELEEELNTLRKQFEDPSLNEAKKKEIYDEIQRKQNDGIAMTRSLKEYLDRKRRQVQDEMQRQMRGILEEISQLLEEKAKAEGYDFVFDKSGNSTTQVPVVLYSKDTFDITESLLTELNKDAPAE